MERHLLERMIGAGILLIVLVVVVPMVLNGNGGESGDDLLDELGQDGERVHIIRPDGVSSGPPVAKDMANSQAERQPPQAQDPASENTQESSSSSAAPPVQSQPDAAVASPPPAPEPEEPAVAKLETPVAEPPPPRSEPPPPPPAPPAAGGFTVQLGAYGEQSNAVNMEKKLKAAGYDAYISQLERNGKTLHQVRVGREQDRDDAAVLAERLAADGFKGVVVRR